MKKCASCTKDLPDAALHCVFCGAKQPPAPAVQPGLAKTAFGYSANEVLDRHGRPIPSQAPPAGNPFPRNAPAPGSPMPAPSGYAPTVMNPPPQPARPAPPSVPPPFAQPAFVQPYPPAAPPAPYVPASAANAKTMFVQAQQIPAPSMPAPAYLQPNPQSVAQTYVPPPAQPMPVAVPVPMRSPHAPMMAIPAAQPPPYFGSQTSRTIRPHDPWRDSLRAMMFLWGVALLAAFATPVAMSPNLVFNWKVILDGEGTARLPPLMLAAVGFLNVVVAFIPMPSAARGVIAAVLGLGGIAVPIALVGIPPWQAVVPMVGVLVLVPGLLIRDEYRDSILPRLLVTLGVLGTLAPLLVPQSGAIPLVAVFKGLIELPGSQKVGPALQVGLITVVVMSLLAWLPAPVTGAAKLWAWLLILWPLISHVTMLLLRGHVGDAVTTRPYETIVPWIAGGSGVLGAAYVVIVGYGLAAVLGRQLE